MSGGCELSYGPSSVPKSVRDYTPGRADGTVVRDSGSLTRRSRVGGCAQRRGERDGVAPIAVEAPAVDEERRGPVDAAPDAALEVRADARPHRAGRQVLGDDGRFDARRGRVLDQIVGL